MDRRRRPASLLRLGSANVTNVELFFDLVYVFAITQLSHRLVEHPTLDGAVQTAVLLAMVWQAWVYTTWSCTYLDPGRDAVRTMLLAVMLSSLVLAAGISEAFESRGMLVALAYIVIQVGRCLFMVYALRGEALQITFVRIIPWTAVSSTVVYVGALEHGHVREALWAGAVAIDLIGAGFGFYVPGLSHSATTEWTVDGGHFAERCQGFVLIALGESIVVTGSKLAAIEQPTAAQIAAFAAAFLASVGLWWIYFDRTAEESSQVIAASADPGQLARDAFHWVHPLIVFGIIVGAAADELVLADPTRHGSQVTTWLMLGGAGAYLGGHAIFKAIMWRVVSWPRVIAVAVLALLFVPAPHLSALALGVIVLVVIIAVAATDRVQHPPAAAVR